MNDRDAAGGEPRRVGPAAEAFELFGDLPRRAADQAGAIIGRLMQAFDTDADRDRLATGEPSPSDPSFTQLRTSLSRAMDLYLDLFQRTMDSYIELMEVSMRRRGMSVTAHDGGGLQVERRDGSPHATGTLFVHNYSGEAATMPQVRVTDLVAADGSVVPARDVRVDVPGDGIADRSTISLEVSVSIDGAAPGVYFGHALAGEDAVPIRLTVTDP